MESRVQTITKNLHTVEESITRAAQSAGRDPAGVRLVTVTKAQPVEVIQAAIEAGAKILGENYPEETAQKIEVMGKPGQVAWHMIGHLQSRKSGLVVQYFDVLQSLDSLRLAERLNRQLEDANRVLPVLVEVNVSGEQSKQGWAGATENERQALIPDVEKILTMKFLKLVGLMTMPPLFPNPEDARPYFVRLRKLGAFLGQIFQSDCFQEYSMGTSADYTIAVQEGATLVRVGQAIVGPRPLRR